MKNSDIDKPAVEARKKYGEILKPNPDCKKCKGKGEGNAKLRCIVSCSECWKDQPETPILDDNDLEYKKTSKKSKRK